MLSGLRCPLFAVLLGIVGIWILGCTSTKPGQVVDTEQTGPKQDVGASYSIEVAEHASSESGRVILTVQEIPKYRVPYVRKRVELKKRSPAFGWTVTTLGLVGIGVGAGIAPECFGEEQPGKKCETSEEKSKAQRASTVLLSSLGALVVGYYSVEWAKKDTSYSPTDERIVGESETRTEEGSPTPLAGEPISLTLNGTTQRYTTDGQGRVSVDVADAFGVRSLEEPRPQVASAVLPGRDFTQSLTLNPKEWMVPYFRLNEARYRLREGPSREAPVLGVTRREDTGEEFRAQARRTDWVELEYGGEARWIHRDAGTVFWAVPTRIKDGRLPRVTASAEFNEPSGNNRLDADETAQVRVSARNEGEGPAYRVQTYVEPETHPHLSYPQSIEFGRIDAGQSKTKTIRVASDRKLSSGQTTLTFRFREANGFAPSPLKLRFETQRFVPPELSVVDVGIDDANGDGIIDRGELVNVTARIQNVSKGRAQAVSARVDFGEDVFPASNTPQSFDLGNLGPGEYQDIRFRFYTNQQAQSLPVTLDLTEEYGEFGKQGVELPLDFNQPTDTITVVDVEGQDETVTVDKGLSIDVETNIPTTPMDRPDAVAVVIGNRKYRNGDVPNVKYALRDARTVKKYLTQTLGFREDNIIYESNASAAAMTRIFGTADDPEGKLYNWVKPGKSDVFVYFSGHGAPSLDSGTAYLLPTNTNPNYLSQNGYPVEQLYENLGKVPARSVTVALEACFSGISEGGSIVNRASPVKLSVENPILSMENGLAFTAGTADQVASWYSEKKHGLFTYYFLKGLKGEANQNDDRRVTVREMEAYLSGSVPPRARRAYNREQTPQVIGQNKDRTLVRYGSEDRAPSN